MIIMNKCLTDDERNFINLLHKLYIEETKEGRTMEKSYPTIDYPARCSHCGKPCNHRFLWEDMQFCSESCMNREKEYWHDVDQMKMDVEYSDLPKDEFGNYDPKGNY
jgi:hypothetical protein